MGKVEQVGFQTKITIAPPPESLLRSLPAKQREEVENYYSELKNKRRNALKKIATVGMIEAKKKERAVVGGKKSGYIPTGNLQRSITDEVTEDEATVFTTAESKKGYPYGVAVEFGTKKMAATPYMRPTAALMIEKAEKIAKGEMHK